MYVNIIQACKGALQKLGPLMKSEQVNGMFQRHLNPEESLLYPDFLNDLCKLLVGQLCTVAVFWISLQVADFTEKVNSYVMNSVMFFKSMWPEVKRNAALFVGMFNPLYWRPLCNPHPYILCTSISHALCKPHPPHHALTSPLYPMPSANHIPHHISCTPHTPKLSAYSLGVIFTPQ